MTPSDPRFYATLLEMLGSERSFAVATVVNVRGSASGKPGAKAIFDEHGHNLHGWVGGGCVERFTGEQAVAAIAEGRPRLVVADLDDEVLGLGMPCGGVMDIYIEPVRPRPPLFVAGDGPSAKAVVTLGARLGFRVVAHAPGLVDDWQDPMVSVRDAAYEVCDPPRGARMVVASRHRGDEAALAAGLRADASYLGLVANRTRAAATRARLAEVAAPERVAAIRAPAGLDLGGRRPVEIAMSVLAEILAEERGVDVDALERAAGAGPAACPSPGWSSPELVVVGHSRIAEALADLAAMLEWPITLHAVAPAPHQRAGYPATVRWVSEDPGFQRLPASPSTAVVVASHHKGDERAIAAALGAGAPYVGLVASASRSRLIRERLPGSLADTPGVLRAPAGLAIGARTPAEIALSIVVEILALLHGRSGRALTALEELPARRGGPCLDAGVGER
jgi:xanthine dehydrogenase accessory factor